MTPLTAVLEIELCEGHEHFIYRYLPGQEFKVECCLARQFRAELISFESMCEGLIRLYPGDASL